MGGLQNQKIWKFPPTEKLLNESMDRLRHLVIIPAYVNSQGMG